MAWPFGDLKRRHYRVILMDPPWSYQMHSDKGHGKSPEAHYATLHNDALRALPVADLAARRCMLIMWTTWPHLEQALALMGHYGFAYKTGGPWVKRTASGKAAFGTGFLLRSATEAFLIGTRGGAMAGTRSARNLIETDEELDGWEIDALRRKHSRKPDEMRVLAERLSAGGPACELFARSPWPGRDVWGNETGRFAE